jgi:hypothetical protein
LIQRPASIHVVFHTRVIHNVFAGSVTPNPAVGVGGFGWVYEFVIDAVIWQLAWIFLWITTAGGVSEHFCADTSWHFDTDTVVLGHVPNIVNLVFAFGGRRRRRWVSAGAFALNWVP